MTAWVCAPPVRLGRGASLTPRCTSGRRRQTWRRAARMNADAADDGTECFELRKVELQVLLEGAATSFLDEGWKRLVRWRQPLFAPDVAYTFPFMSESSGRVQLHLMLRYMHVITVWRALDARVSGTARVTSPKRNQLVLVWRIAMPREDGGGAPVEQDVRIVLHLDATGLVTRWDETWSWSTEEVLERVWNLGDDWDDDAFEDGNARVGVLMPSRPAAESKAPDGVIQARVDALVDFLTRSLPKVATRGPAAWGGHAALRAHLADDGQLETPLGTVHGADNVAHALTAGWSLLIACFHPRHMELIAIHRHGARVVNAKYALRGRGRLGGHVGLITSCRFYVDPTGKIARQAIQCRFDRTLGLGV